MSNTLKNLPSLERILLSSMTSPESSAGLTVW